MSPPASNGPNPAWPSSATIPRGSSSITKLRSILSNGLSESGRFDLLQAQFLLHRVTDLEFLNLAGDGLRKRLNEFDVPRNFVVGELLAAELADFVGGDGAASLQLDPNAKFLAIFWIRYADDGGLLNGGVGKEELFDLAGIDVFATTDHKVF